MQSADLLQTTRSMIAEVLALDLDEVQPHARWTLDLHGESIDLLELSFLIEKHLRLKVDFGRLFSAGAIETNDSGVITPAALARIREAMPFLDFHRLPPSPTPQALYDGLLTVAAIAEIIGAELLSSAQSPTADCAGSLTWTGPELRFNSKVVGKRRPTSPNGEFWSIR